MSSLSATNDGFRCGQIHRKVNINGNGGMEWRWGGVGSKGGGMWDVGS